MFATQNGPWADKPPQLPNSLGLPVDGFWEENEVRFPSAWPEKLTLPIAINDLSTLPAKGKYKLLALEETVLAFWRFVSHCYLHKESAAKELAKLVSEGGGSAEGTSSQDGSSSAANKEKLTNKIARMDAEIDKAHNLCRNVSFALWFVENEEERERRSLDQREEVDTHREYLGLAGWNKILVIGRKRDALRAAGKVCNAEAVAQEFAAVTWGPGRAINTPTVQKCLPIYTRFAKESAIVDIVLLSQGLWGRDSLFEEWTKLTIFANSERPLNEVLWCMQTVVEERISGKKRDNWSKDDLKKKASPLNISGLRLRAVEGLLSQFIDPCVQACKDSLNVKPEAQEVLSIAMTPHTPMSCSSNGSSGGSSSSGSSSSHRHRHRHRHRHHHRRHGNT